MELPLLLQTNLPTPPGLPWPALIARWIHILSAIIALGGPFFVRFFLTPAAAATLDPQTHAALRERILARWRHLVYLLIAAFILSGVYTFGVVGRWRDPTWTRDDRALYHMLFGVKTILALAMFFLASALAGRAAAFAPIRRGAKTWTSIFLLLGLLVVLLAGVLRYLPARL